MFSIILCCSFHNFVTNVLYFHHILVYFVMINLTSLLECDGDNTQVSKIKINLKSLSLSPANLYRPRFCLRSLDSATEPIE